METQSPQSKLSHWQSVYTTKEETRVSWYQEHPTVSLALIHHAQLLRDSPIIDVGGGASHLVDALLAEGFTDVMVLDIAAAALNVAQSRLGPLASAVTWLAADVTAAVLPRAHYALWHDRAVFHFLTDKAQRQKYVQQMQDAVVPGGHVIIATFALDGPTECSGLPVMRYNPENLAMEMGSEFILREHTTDIHPTPFGTEQQFIYGRFQKV